MMLAYLDPQLRLAPAAAGDLLGDEIADPDRSGGEIVGGDRARKAAEEASRDFGGIVTVRPAAVIRPATAEVVAAAVRMAARSAAGLTVAARGNGHSVAGQSMAEGGLVLEMRALEPRLFELAMIGGAPHADVPGGALWEEVLEWGVREHGMAPASWTDYLRLTVGGTLSNGGISGQAFKKGPQISNVSEMEIVTGDGELHVCTPADDLFHAVLGGLGQFGVITRAKIPLLPAPDMVRWIRVVYGEFEEYARDAESVVSRGEFDYVEGFAFVNREGVADGWGGVPIGESSEFDPALIPPRSGPLLYCLELVLHHSRRDDGVDERVEELLRRLKYVRGLEFTADVTYVNFLSRVRRSEEAALASGSWDAPHPWLNILISASDVAAFDRAVMKGILRDGIGGPMLVYPLLKSKWDPRASVALPERKEEMMFLVALLRFTAPYPAGPAAEEMVAQNREIIDCCRANGYDFKLYLPHYESEDDWASHFGAAGWARFADRKARYDPLAILSPGQCIFRRRSPGSKH